MIDIASGDFSCWKRSDAQLCMVLKNTIKSSLKQMFRAYNTCLEVYEQTKLLYTNDTRRLYGVCHNLFNVVALENQDSMADYLGKIHALFHEFNEASPPACTPPQDIEQRLKFFMVLALHKLANKYFHVRDQILGSPIIPNFTSTWSTLLCVSSKPINDTIVSTDPLLWHLNVMIATALPSQEKSVRSVIIVAS